MTPERTGLTPATRKCFAVIEAHILRTGCSPSYDDIRIAMGLASKGVVHRLVNDLVARGWVTYTPRKKCSIVIIAAAPAIELPAALQTALKHYCARYGVVPSAVVAAAVAAFIGPDRLDRAA